MNVKSHIGGEPRIDCRMLSFIFYSSLGGGGSKSISESSLSSPHISEKEISYGKHTS